MASNPAHRIDPEGLAERVERLDGVRRLREAAGDAPLYLVGGVVRDLLLGKEGEHPDLDVVAESDPRPIAEALGGEMVEHQRFSTASVKVDGALVDLARAREEAYPEPGALPEVRPAGIEQDLARRDFTVNAMAVPLWGDHRLIDPHGGLADLRDGVLRLLHPRSLRDDPTRALRGARYAARHGLAPDAETRAALAEADLSTVSADRVDAELRRLALEPRADLALELLAEWGLFDLPSDLPRLAGHAAELARAEPWSTVADPGDVLLAALDRDPDRGETSRRALELAREGARRPSEVARAARGRPGTELVLARALGAEWLDAYLDELRHVELEIDGGDLIEAGVPQGPAVGRGLDAARAAKLDGEASGRDRELEVALAAARERR